MKHCNQIIIETEKTHPLVGTIHSIPLSEVYPATNSPYKIRNDASMQELIASIRSFGILVPVEVRKEIGGGYEIISGSRRYHAAQIAELTSIPATILNLDDDDAIIRMVDSNIQRECILPSERALAYKMRMDAIKRKAGRPQNIEGNNLPKISANFRSDDSVGELAGISGDTVRNYIALTSLIPKLMQLVDEKKIQVLSFLNQPRNYSSVLRGSN